MESVNAKGQNSMTVNDKLCSIHKEVVAAYSKVRMQSRCKFRQTEETHKTSVAAASCLADTQTYNLLNVKQKDQLLDEDADHNMSTWLATMEYKQQHLKSILSHFGRFIPSSRIILNICKETDVAYIQIADDSV